MLGVFQKPVTEIKSLLELKYSFLNIRVADFFIERREKVDNGKQHFLPVLFFGIF
jgi:hypothetical protein